MAEVPRAGAEEVDAAVARGRRRPSRPGARSRPETRAALLHALADALDGRARGAGAARGAQRRQADRRRARRDRDGRRHLPLLRRRAASGCSARRSRSRGGVDMTFREPLGVVGLIVPWNFPLAIASWKVAPALAAGNTVVLKPAELTPLTALELERIALEAGLPEGVLNVVAGPGSVCGQRLVEHPDVAKIAFTGSTEVGRGIAAGAAATIKRVTLELGGKSANVVFADADLEAAAAAAPLAVFGNAGQDCCARSRILVERGGARPVPGGARGGGQGDAGRRPARRGDPDGAADLGRPARDGRLLRRRRRARRDPRLGARRTRLLVPADRALPGLERRPRGARGDLRPGRLRDPVRRRGRGGRDRQRHDLRPLGLDLDARRRPRAARRPRDRDRRDLDQLEHLGPRLDARSAASSSPASAASSAPTRSTHYTEVKNVYYATEEG